MTTFLLNQATNIEFWLVLGAVLYLSEMLTGIFYAGAFAVGAFATSLALLGLHLFAPEFSPQNAGMTTALWGVFSLISCVVLKAIHERPGMLPPDVNERPYQGKEE